MGRHYISQKDYLQASQVFHWASREHYLIWFTGKLDRHKRTEVMLPRLAKKGKLKVIRRGRKLYYACPRISRKIDMDKLDHGLGCTEGLVRFWRSRMDCTVIPEKSFRGFGIVAEWGILYPNKKLLLFEFCTADNTQRASMIQNKVKRYYNLLPLISEKYEGEGFVVFVLDMPKAYVEDYVKEKLPIGEEFLFTDYETFKSVPVGFQLSAPIYLWGIDGERYPISK